VRTIQATGILTKLSKLEPAFRAKPELTVEAGEGYKSWGADKYNHVHEETAEGGLRLVWRIQKHQGYSSSGGASEYKFQPWCLQLDPASLKEGDVIRVSFDKPKKPLTGRALIEKAKMDPDKTIYSSDGWTTNGQCAVRIETSDCPDLPESALALFQSVERQAKPAKSLRVQTWGGDDPLDVLVLDGKTINRKFADTISRQWPGTVWALTADGEMPIAVLMDGTRAVAVIAAIVRKTEPDITGDRPYNQPGTKRTGRKRLL